MVLANSKSFSNPNLGASKPLKPSDFIYVKFCKLMARLSALSTAIFVVVFSGSKPKVIWSNASRVVAFVKDAFSVWNRTPKQYPRSNVGENASSVGQSRVNPPISISGYPRHPEPATIGYSNLGPESTWKSDGKLLRRQIFASNLVHSSVICAFGVQARRAFSLSPCKIQVQ